MRKRFYRILATLMATALLGQAMPLVSIAASSQGVDRITLETEAEDMADRTADLGWRTEQDKGKWIKDMNIANDVTSLILIVNNLGKSADEALPDIDSLEKKERPRRKTVPGNSRLYYLNQNEKGEWKQVFTINCTVSGGPTSDDNIYGVYRLESAFGSKENPGSLVKYWQLTADDYWITDPKSDDYMKIVRMTKKPDSKFAINLEEMRAYSNYGMILRPEYEGEAHPGLIINCQQSDTVDRTVSSVQLSESYVRMLIQAIDGNTRIMVAAELEDFEGM